MPNLIRRVFFVVVALSFAAQAVAQTTQPLTLAPERWPRWDASGGWGLFYLKPIESDEFDESWDAHGEVRFDLGRYWTPHLKTEVGVGLPQGWTDYRYESIPVVGLPSGGYVFTDIDRRLTTVSPAFTYQFLENTFAHPYVSGGVRLAVLETHEYRSEAIHTQNRISYTAPGLDERNTTVRAHPFLAAGFKSYFNDRVFVRTEALAALGTRGGEQMTFRIGFGVDF